MTRVVVAGAGIAGLSIAWALRRRDLNVAELGIGSRLGEQRRRLAEVARLARGVERSAPARYSMTE